MIPPLTTDERRVLHLVGALCVPTRRRLEIGLGLRGEALDELLSSLSALNLISGGPHVYVLLSRGRLWRAQNLLEDARRPRVHAPRDWASRAVPA